MTEEIGLGIRIARFFRKRERQVGILAVVTALALLCAFWNMLETRKELEYSTLEYCEEITAQMCNAVNSTIDEKQLALVNLADSISRTMGADTGKVENFLERKAKILGFDALFFIGSQETCIAQVVEGELDLDADSLIRQVQADPSFAEKVHVGFIEGQTLYYSVPVPAEDGKNHVLIGVHSRKTMQQIISSSAFQGQTLSCIVDSRGDTVLSPTDAKPFADLDSLFKDNGEADGIQADMAAGRAGSLDFTSVTGRHNLLTYNPLQNSQWYLLTIMPVDLLAGNASTFFLRTMAVVLALALIFLVFLRMLYRISSDSQKQLSLLAYQDDVTGGMNNAAFQQRYREEQRLSRPTIVLLNVRRFKLINEKLGYGAGNRILRLINQELDVSLNGKAGEFVARSEMDNFFLCVDGQDPERIRERVQTMEKSINRRVSTVYPGVRLSFAAGCCIVEDRAEDIRILQDRTRIALRDESVTEENSCAFYSEKIAQRLKGEQDLNTIFDTSLEDRDFLVYLQPKVNLKTGRLSGAEALVRWNHPERGVISPGDFIPMLERNGKICRLDFYMFEEICKFYWLRREQGKPWHTVSVNLSRYHFYEDGFLDKFQAVRQRYGLPDGAIEFELTESMFFDREHNERIKKGIRQMHEMGFRCSMDDFGSGYSSLGILKEFDVDVIKMDRSFFLDMGSEKARDIIRSVVELAAKLNMETVAEGIEDTEQMEFLHSIQCDTVQGYYFSKPLPINDYENWADRYERASRK